MAERFRLATTAAALALLLVACSDSEGAPPTDSPSSGNSEVAAADLPDPCALIDQADVDDIFGTPVDPGESRETRGSGNSSSGRACHWTQGLATVDAAIVVSTNYLVPLTVCDWCEPVDGYGDEAWGGTTDQGSGGGTLAIIADDLGVQIQAFGPDVTLEQLGTLADSLLAELP